MRRIHNIDQIVQTGNKSRTPIPSYVCIDSVPHAFGVESYYKGVKKGRAPGVDGIANDVYEIAPLMIARLYAPLYAKMALQVREPLSRKGGIISSFLKNASLPSSGLESQRNVLLGVGSCKGSHRITRKRIEPSLNTYACETQRGGILARRPDFASHIVRLLFCSQKCRYTSTTPLSPRVRYQLLAF